MEQQPLKEKELTEKLIFTKLKVIEQKQMIIELMQEQVLLTDLLKDLVEENKTIKEIKAMAKDVLKEILNPNIYNKKLSKKQQFELDVEANLDKSNLQLIKKFSLNTNKGK